MFGPINRVLTIGTLRYARQNGYTDYGQRQYLRAASCGTILSLCLRVNKTHAALFAHVNSPDFIDCGTSEALLEKESF